MQRINLSGDNKYFLEFEICKKSDWNSDIDSCNFNFNDFKMPTFYLSGAKQESVIGYKLLYYLYFKKFNKYLDMSKIILNDNNKPCFNNANSDNYNNLYFNISHSKNFVSCVLTDFAVGLDIEEERIIKPSACKRFICNTEYDYIQKCSYSEIQVWNIKEAYAKYLGLGLKLNFKDVYVKSIVSNYSIIIKNFYINNHKIFLSICFSKNIKLN